MKDAILEALKTLYDPCCREKRISVVDMGLIESGPGNARVQLVLISGWRPFAAGLLSVVQDRLAGSTA